MLFGQWGVCGVIGHNYVGHTGMLALEGELTEAFVRRAIEAFGLKIVQCQLSMHQGNAVQCGGEAGAQDQAGGA